MPAREAPRFYLRPAVEPHGRDAPAPSPHTPARLQTLVGNLGRHLELEGDVDRATQTRKPTLSFLLFGLFLLRAETATPPRPEPQPPPRSPRQGAGAPHR
jgi:hypothetical protein